MKPELFHCKTCKWWKPREPSSPSVLSPRHGTCEGVRVHCSEKEVEIDFPFNPGPSSGTNFIVWEDWGCLSHSDIGLSFSYCEPPDS